MTFIRQGRRCRHAATATALVATLAMVAGFLATAISSAAPAGAATTTTTTTTFPGSDCSATVTGTAFGRTGWVASTNAPSSSADAPAHALDGDLTTRFSTNEDQAPDLYLQVDLGSAHVFDALGMRVPNSPTDYARGYEVQVSTNATSWTTVASCTGTATPEVVSFPVQTARYLRVVLTASGANWWSIDELNVYGAPVITSAASLQVVAGQANTLAITTTGAPVPTLSLSGTLPPDLAFGANSDGTATISGTPPASARGTYEVTVTATNGVGSPAVQHLVLTLAAAPAITSASGWRVVPGRSSSFTVTTTGSPAPTLSLSGALPAGLVFKDNANGTATISGTPASSAGGTYQLTITATNGVASAAVQHFTLTLGNAPVITSAASAGARPGQYNAFTITTTGSPAPTLSVSGTLPPGLVFRDNGNGTATLSGTPPASATGAYELTITATNAEGSVNQYLLVTLGAAPAFSSRSGVEFVPTAYNSFTVIATGSPAPTLSVSGTLPPGLVFKDNGNGTATISGTPPGGTVGLFPLTITATNGVGNPAVQHLLLQIGPAPSVARAPTFTSTSSWQVRPGQFNAFTVTTSASPVPSISLSGGNLAPGLVFRDNRNDTATISGTVPSGARGTYEVSITATNGVGHAVQYLVIRLGGSRTTTTLSSSANPAALGQAVTYTVKVAPVPNGGTVNFLANGALIGGCVNVAVSTSTGEATCTTTYSSIGTREVQASYSGNAAYGPSSSAVHAEVASLPAAGYWLATANGHVYGLGGAPSLGSMTTSATTGAVVGIAATPDARGYWVVTANGTVASFGDARFYGDLPDLAKHVRDIVAIAPTSDGRGYYLVGADGGFFTFGDAKFHGSLPGIGLRVKDVVGVVTTPGGKGYLLVGADGGVFTFGTTHFYGSLPGIGKHVHDIRAILPSSTGKGYILVGADGGAFNFGSGAKFHGSLPGEGIYVSNIVGIALTPDDGGYYMAGNAGRVYGFGDAHPAGEPAGLASELPVAAIAGT